MALRTSRPARVAGHLLLALIWVWCIVSSFTSLAAADDPNLLLVLLGAAATCATIAAFRNGIAVGVAATLGVAATFQWVVPDRIGDDLWHGWSIVAMIVSLALLVGALADLLLVLFDIKPAAGATRLVGLSGYARSGKDTAAAALIAAGWQRVAFADKLRAVADDSNPWVMQAGGSAIKLHDLVARVGWEEAKKNPDVREFLQNLGVSVRKRLGEDTWVNAAFLDVDKSRPVVITDCRFPNEAQAIKARGGKIVRISRDTVRAVNAHESETALDDYQFDAYLDNSGSVEGLHEAIRLVAQVPPDAARVASDDDTPAWANVAYHQTPAA